MGWTHRIQPILMDSQDLERIAKHALRELGAGDVPLTITPESETDRWRVHIGGSEQMTMSIRAGAGTSPQFIREQIFDQFSGR
jgi:hypothetical protein